MEAVGVVEAVGAGVETFAVGDRVGYTGVWGAYCEARLVPADRLVPVPPELDDETAAAVMLEGMTVEYLVRRTYPVQAGQTVLWHAAAGGVGLISCQWLKALGVTVISTVGSAEKAALALAHGCDHTILHEDEDFVARVRDLTDGRGVPVVFDSVGKSTFPASLDCLQPRGLFVGFGNASGKPEPFDMGLLAQKGSLFLTRPTLMTYTAVRKDLLESARALFSMVASGKVQVEIRQRWPLRDAAAAHRALESCRTVGSSILSLC